MEPSSNSELSHIPDGIANGEEENEKIRQLYLQTLAAVQQGNGFHSPNDIGLSYYQNFWYHDFYLQGVMLAQKQFKSKATDIFLCSAPKSGTTWLKALAFAIVTRNWYDFSANPLLVTMPHDCVPLLEIDVIFNPTSRNPKLPLLASHIPFTSLPESIASSGCKIVYICRDPKDAFVSYWHFICKVRTKELESLSFEQAFELFCNGISYYGPYWDHILGYWKASLEMPERVLFLQYEDMMRDTAVYVKKLAEFIDFPFSPEEEKGGMIDTIVELCSFEKLSNLEVNKTGKHRPQSPVVIENSTYFRKGKVGDWKNHLTAEMAKRMDQITDQKFRGFGLTIHGSSDEP